MNFGEAIEEIKKRKPCSTVRLEWRRNVHFKADSGYYRVGHHP